MKGLPIGNHELVDAIVCVSGMIQECVLIVDRERVWSVEVWRWRLDEVAATARPAFLAVAPTLESSCIESDEHEGAALFDVKRFSLSSQAALLGCDHAYGLRSCVLAQNQAPTSLMALHLALQQTPRKDRKTVGKR